MKFVAAILAACLVGVSCQNDTTTAGPRTFLGFTFPTFAPLPALPGLPGLTPGAVSCVGRNDIRGGFCRAASECAAHAEYAESPCALNPQQVCCVPVSKLE